MTPSLKIYFHNHLCTVKNLSSIHNNISCRTILLPKGKHIIRYKCIIFLFMYMEEGFIFLMIEAQWHLTPNVQKFILITEYGIILTPLLSSGTTLGIWNHWCLKSFSSISFLNSAMHLIIPWSLPKSEFASTQTFKKVVHPLRPYLMLPPAI